MCGTINSYTADVSAGGFSLEAMTILPPGTEISGKLILGSQEFSFTGQVVWAKFGEPRLNKRGRMGVKFLQVADGFNALMNEGTAGGAG